MGKSITDMQLGNHNGTPPKPGILKVRNKFANTTPSENDANGSQTSGSNPRQRMQQNLKNKLQVDEKDIVQEDLTGET